MSTLSVPRYGDHGRLLSVYLLWSRLLERRAGRLGRRRLCQSFLPAMRSATAWYSFGLLASSCCSPPSEGRWYQERQGMEKAWHRAAGNLKIEGTPKTRSRLGVRLAILGANRMADEPRQTP